ncbi:MAG: AtpZ/AtpI family protein [Planctomycetaceae bacterium]|nr:AtpZ/AtpI family protein [Planctomycetaceae bacterium]
MAPLVEKEGSSGGDKRPPMAVAMEWVSRITTVALMMVLPAGGGYWLDQRCGTGPWLLVLGAGGGLILGMMLLMAMVDGAKRNKTSGRHDKTS